MPLPPARLFRLFWPYLVLWLLIAGALAAFTTHEIASARERELVAGRGEAENLARVLREQVTRAVEGFGRTLRIIKLVHETTRGAIELATLVASLDSGSGSDIERRVVRYDRDGRLADATDAEAKRVRPTASDLPWFRAARERGDGHIVIGEPTLGRVSGRMVIPMAVRLDGPDGAFDGVLATALDQERLAQLFRAIRVGDRSVTGIMDREGRLYVWSVSTDPGAPGAAASGTRRPAQTSTLQEPRTLKEVADPRGVIELSAVPGTDLVAFAALSEERLFGDQQRYARNLVGYALLTLVALTLPIALVAGRALREVTRRSRLEQGIAFERAQARTDALTGAGNRRAFEAALTTCHSELVERGRPFALAAVDVDRFKRLNDTQGHAAGDRALQRIAATLAGGTRRSDVVARLGGDEFAVLMPDAGADAMRRPFDAIFTALTVAVAGEGWPISFSIGVIAFESAPPSPQQACALADQLMYAVKQSGRNGVRFAVYRDGRLHPAAAAGYVEAESDLA